MEVRLKKRTEFKLGTEYTVTDFTGKTLQFVTSRHFFGEEDQFANLAIGSKLIISGQIDRDDKSVLYATELIATEFPG